MQRQRRDDRETRELHPIIEASMAFVLLFEHSTGNRAVVADRDPNSGVRLPQMDDE